MRQDVNTKPLSRFELRRERTRQRLKASVSALVVEKGYDAVTIQNITEHADVGIGTFYVHFKNKEEIVWTVIRESFEEMERASRQFLAGLSLEQRDYLNFLGFFQYIGQKGGLLRAASLGQDNAILTRYIADYTAKRAEQRLHEHNTFEVFDIPAQVAAQFMTGALMRLVAWWISTANDYTAEQMAAMFYKLLFRQDPLPPSSDL
jgi:AcrR family transcriptional regulator